MKPPPFRYHAPTELTEALDLLREVGSDGKVLAGGQSLVPLLNMRLVAPGHLVDINRLDLTGVSVGPAGIRVGALARHAEVERDAGAHRALPLLRQALGLVAHPVIRNRGTVVGSLVHADPAGELTAVLALLGGSVELASPGAPGGPPAVRTVTADGFFRGPLESAARPDELALAATFPLPPPGTGTAFVELARRHGDYALAGVAAAVTCDGGLRVTSARAAYLALAPVPLVLDLTAPLADRGGRPGDGEPDRRALDRAGALAAGAVDPESDIHATAGYRRHLAAVLTRRALAQACGEAVRQVRPDAAEARA